MNTDQATSAADRGSALSEGLGAADPERADFEAWISDDGKFPQAAGRDERGEYRLLQAYGAWKAWQAASAAQRARTADLCGNMAAVAWAEWDERADPADQGKAMALEHLAALLAEPNDVLAITHPKRDEAGVLQRAQQVWGRTWCAGAGRRVATTDRNSKAT